MGRLADRRAIVTGAGSGIGYAVAAAFLAEGARVLAFDLRFDDAPRLDGERLVRFVGDVRDLAAVDAAVVSAVASFGGLDVLCNIAGVAAYGRLDTMTEADLAAVMDVNFYGPFRFMKAALPHLVAGGCGAVINVASVGAIRARPNLSAYAASKAALLALTRGVAVDHAADGLTVNAILPGVVGTPMIGSGDGVAARASRGQPLDRVGCPAEIAALATLLASTECRYATAAEFIVDGGRSAT